MKNIIFSVLLFCILICSTSSAATSVLYTAQNFSLESKEVFGKIKVDVQGNIYFQTDNSLASKTLVHIQVLDSSDRLIKTVNNSPIAQMDDLQPGMYTIIVWANGQQHTAKVLITLLNGTIFLGAHK